MKKIKYYFVYTVMSVVLALCAVSCVTANAENTGAETPAKVSQKSNSDSEYERATRDLKGETVSKDTYEKDKKIILAKIDELNGIMKDKNYKSWLSYIDQNSINYWSQKKNLSTASKQLPVKGIQLKNLEDYFNYVFIPSRVGRKIDEIRYLSASSIKAVQVRGDDVVIFYNFKKVDGEWLVEIPTL
ncbi:MAG: hypothetical protein IK002_11005 [Treponema sp.]|uniref:hypothetical protein n=1 Tax=Treponema sp. TaxID=166 RepID=UPI00298E68C6|nr:hypothetical protein [Treponema sp.]MBR5934500.1 hypothetical protein [Treponema sp.]